MHGRTPIIPLQSVPVGNGSQRNCPRIPTWKWLSVQSRFWSMRRFGRPREHPWACRARGRSFAPPPPSRSPIPSPDRGGRKYYDFQCFYHQIGGRARPGRLVAVGRQCSQDPSRPGRDPKSCFADTVAIVDTTITPPDRCSGQNGPF